MGKLLTSLRSRLLFLVFLTLLPGLGLTLYHTGKQRQSAANAAQEEALNLVRIIAREQHVLIEGAHQLLSVLARLPDSHYADPVACGNLFSDLVEENPIYANLGLIEPNGDIFCSGLPFSGNVNLADRAYFQRAIATRTFASGDYQVGRITGRSSINFGYPVLDEKGEVTAVLFAALDLLWLNQLVGELNLPESTVLTLIDQSGTILARYPDATSWLGQPFPETEILAAITAQRREGAAEVTGQDGIERLYGFASLLDQPAAGPVVVVERPTAITYRDAHQNLIRALSQLGLVMGLTLLVVGLFSQRLVLGRLELLLQATRRLAQGDLNARAHLADDAGELSQLGEAFDEMATSLQQQISRREVAEQRLRQHVAHLQLVSDVTYAFTEETTDFPSLVDTIARRFAELLPDACFVRLLTEDEQWLDVAACYDPDPEMLAFVSEILNTNRMRADSAIPAQVLRDREPLLIPEIPLAQLQKSIRPEFWPVLESFSLRSLLVVPLRAGGRAIGLLYHYRYLPNNDPFDQDDLFLAQAMADRAALTLVNGRLYQTVQAELSRRREAEKRLRDYATVLERSNRDLQEFAYVASHDLQEPLRKILAFGGRLRTDLGDRLTPKSTDYLDRMENASQRMQRLINDLLAYSRVTTKGKPFAPVDLGFVAQGVVSDLELRLEQTGGRIELGDLPVIEADQLQMGQLLQNLISNALKFHRPAVPPVVTVETTLIAEGQVQIQISDNGIGFDEKYLDRIFQPFQRLHGRSEYEGAGMGLAICRKIVERHNGRLTARSSPGQGTVFIISLPQRQPRQETIQ